MTGHPSIASTRWAFLAAIAAAIPPRWHSYGSNGSARCSADTKVGPTRFVRIHVGNGSARPTVDATASATARETAFTRPSRRVNRHFRQFHWELEKPQLGMQYRLPPATITVMYTLADEDATVTQHSPP